MSTKEYLFNNEVKKEDVIKGLKKIPNSSVDVIVCDPPYNIGKEFGECKDQMPLEDYVKWCSEWMDECLRILKPTGSFYVYGFSEVLAYLFVASKAEFKRWLVWHYTNKNSATAHFWQRSHESIILMGHQKPLFNEDDVREPYTENFLSNSAGKKRTGTIGRFNKEAKETIYNAHENGALPRDVLKQSALAGGAGSKERAYWCDTCSKTLIGSKEKKEHLGHEIINHPTQKPLELSRRLIKAAKNPGYVNNVVVPFAGSGAELVAAKLEGCNVVGFEIDDKFVKLGNEWLGRIDSNT